MVLFSQSVAFPHFLSAMRRFVIVFILLSLAGLMGGMPRIAHAQSGPGGVDDTDAANGTALRIWLRADENVTTNGNGEVTGWTNLVGGTAQTNVNGAPTLETGALGGKPAIRFNEGVSNVNNATDYLDFNTEDGDLSGDNTLIVVSKNSGELFNIFNQAPIALGTGDFPDSGNPDGRGLVYSLDTQTGGEEVALAAVNGDAKGQGNDALSGDVAADLTYNVTPFRIFSSVVNDTGGGGGGGQGGGGSQDLLANGEVIEPAGNAASRTKSTARVGERLIGEVAEVIVLDRQVNAAELTVIHNYLSTKYGVSLANAVPDRYEYDSGHPGEVAGVGDTTSSIGNAPAGATTTAQSSGLYVDASGSLNADEFALYGHNNANFAFTAIEPPNGRSNVQKLAREWRVDLSNADFTGGNSVEVGIDETALATSEKISSTSDYNDYFLYVDSDGDFSDGNATAYDLTNRGNRLFTNTDVEISDGDYVTIARIKRTLNFTKALGSGFEDNAGTVSVTAQINFKTSAPIDVSASAEPLTGDPNLPAATGGGDDFTDNGATWSFSAGTTEDSPNVFTVESDGANEPTELLKVTPPTPGSYPNGLAPGDTTQFEYSILDQDNTDKIEFASGNPTSTMEGNTTVTFDVEVSNSGSGTAFFNIIGDATAGEDYEIKTGSDTTRGKVSLSGGTGSFDITILDDNISEASENLNIKLYAAKNGATLKDGGTLSQTFTINDNDGVPSVSFTSGSYSGDEGTDVDVTLSLDASAGQDLDVKVEDDGSGDASGSDYTFSSPKTVTVPSGNTEKTFSVTLNGDGTVEPTETIGLSIVDDADTEPNLSTTNPTATTIYIQDNSGVGKVGPGGVGNASSLSLWLRPDEGVTTDGNGITSWEDQSGNGNDATQVDDAEKPAFGNTTINGIQVATFDGSDDFLRTNISSLPSSSHTLFSVSEAVNTNNVGAVFGIADGSYTSVRTLEYDPNINTVRALQDGSQTGGVGTGGVSILASEFDGSNVNIRVNGGTATSTGTGINANGSFSFVGAEVQNSGTADQPVPAAQDPFNGNLGEIIAYNQTLNKAQRLIVENYLAAKYAISSDSLAKDLYAGDLGADGTEGGGDDRDTDVLGVGRADNGDKHFTASAGGLTISVAGGADNGEYVFAGRKIGVNQRINVTDTSTVNNIGVTARLNDDRYIDVTDDGGTTDGLRVDLTFDFNDIGVRGPAGDVSDYVLLQRADTSGSWTKITPGGGVSSSGSKVTFADVSLTNADDGYFTIATTSSVDSPLDTRFTAVTGQTGTAANNTGSNSNGADAGYLDLGLPITGGTVADIVRPDGNQLFTSTVLGRTGLNSNTGILYKWNYDNQQYSLVTNPSTSLENGRGFTVWIKDSPELPVDPELNFGLDDVSNAPTSNVTKSVSDAGGTYVFLANPYLEAYDMTAFTAGGGTLADNGFQATIASWDPDNGGAYGSYVTKTQGTSGDVISRYQGFFLERSSTGSGATSFTFDNTGRLTDQQEPLVGAKTTAGATQSTLEYRRLSLRLSALDGSGNEVARDVGANLFFTNSAGSGWDAYDAPKYRPPSNTYATIAPLGTGRNGSQIPKSQESRVLTPEKTLEIPLKLRVKNLGGPFELSARDFESIPDAWTVTLIDTEGTADPADDTRHPLRPGGDPYRFGGEEKAQTKANGPPTPGEASNPLRRPLTMQKAGDGTPRFTLEVDPASNPLPVELASFTARTDGEAARLEWTTASETNNAGFEVEHKTDTGFEKVGFVDGAGTTQKPQTYRYRVEGLDYGEHTFRLRQVDQSGTSQLSKTTTTSVRLDEAFKIGTPYPNPFRTRSTLEITVRETQKVRVALYDVLGRRVQVVHDGPLPAQKTHSIRVTDERLSAGMYFFRVKGDSFSEVRRVVHVE